MCSTNAESPAAGSLSATEISAVVQHVDMDLKQDSNCTYPEEEEQQSLADVALTPPCGRDERCSEPDFSQIENSIYLQLQFFLSKADGILDCFIQEQQCTKGDAVVAAVQNVLYTCQPFFNHLENITRSTVSQNNPLPAEVSTKLLDFSQQLCDKLEQMLLGFASHNLLSLDEKEPHSISHFCIGQSQLGQLRLTAFRYCIPTPYLSQVYTGLYKRMRWNVDRLHKDGQGETETDYYFLCYEDSFRAHRGADADSRGHGDLKRMWSIGQWIQVDPDPNSDDINAWILCEVPLGDYRRLLFLGEDEPSSCEATDCMMKLLVTLQKTD
ncbi:UPF0575 protein C19orf67 homolog isoform X2 [Archocentrus centrarchus]|uniref:UPF0575 protein C19orf67 homolog isoform X2 n=1 Tax=Archocentrus centrarchus TaxID=63155 RepID=UPI0011EA082F|nr:UPF0575 protein C19orf67 homolog isoform X2 [Archocentrus centrarchus]